MKIADLCFSYGDKQIFKHYSLALPDTGITALVGPSGCGKTTLLRLLAGLETPDSGIMEAPKPERTAILFQENRLIPRLPAEKQIALVSSGPKPPEYYLEAVGLKGEEKTPPEQLSGGMQRRLALARCLSYAQDKEWMLLDEPFTGVDATRIQALSEVLRNMEIPILFTAHDQESLAMADVILPVSSN